MATLTESTHPGEFIVSEANGHRSREQVTVASGQNLVAGHVVGQVTTGGEIAEYDPAATDGTETVYGVLFSAVDASTEAKPGVILKRDAEVTQADLTFIAGATEAQITTAVGELENLGIIAR